MLYSPIYRMLLIPVSLAGFLCLTAAPLEAGDSVITAPVQLQSPLDREAVLRLSEGSEGKTPTVKNFAPGWIESLATRGESMVYTKENSKDFAYIGMPVGGIGAGQINLSGDGKLWLWDIFNTRTGDMFLVDNGDFQHPYTTGTESKFSDVLNQGFALQVTSEGKTTTRTLDKSGFPAVKFRGQYPIGYVDYVDPACPVQVALEAFSPFVPGNLADSSYPVTLLNYTLTNTSNKPVECVFGGWIENGVAWKSRRSMKVQFRNVVSKAAGYTALNCSAQPALANIQQPEVVDDFESGTFDKWTVEGTAFTTGPLKAGTENRGQRLTTPDNQGQYFVDNETSIKGTLTSKPFEIKHPYITFLIGGRESKKGKECLNLLLDGTAVRSATGRNTTRLRPGYWDVRDLVGKTVQIQILSAFLAGGEVMVDDICLADTPFVLTKVPDYGTMTLALLGDPSTAEGIADLGAQDLSDAVLNSPPTASAQTPDTATNPRFTGGLRRKLTLKPGEKATVNYVLSWNFPNPTGMPVNTSTGRAYGKRFNTSQDVVDHLATNFNRLTQATRLWHNTWYDSTLPYWFLDRTFLNVSTMASTTCYLLDHDRFYADEGGYSCNGTCSHVWSYQQALGFLFPEIEKSLAEQVALKKGNGMYPDGGIALRQEAHVWPAVDGQSGILLRIYQADRMSIDHSFVVKNFSGIKAAMNYLIDHFDKDKDGILEGGQVNTLDSRWWGKVAWFSLYYQAALRATAEMADIAQDPGYATQLRTIADKGRHAIEQDLYDGEYFIEKVDDPAHQDSPGSYTGCEIDQLMGQAWAYHVGMGLIIDPTKATSALNSIWKYSYTTDVAAYNKVFEKGRRFALRGDSGVLTCTFPKGLPENALSKEYGYYFNEVWAGCEHLLASLMMWHGMADKALAVERSINDRYNANSHNPWDEVECGTHYARSMASYGVFTAACGFGYNGPDGALSFAPRLTPENFKAAFTAAEGWGSFSQKREGNAFAASVNLRYGKLGLKTLTLNLPAGQWQAGFFQATVDGKSAPAKYSINGGVLQARFNPEVTLSAGQELRIKTK